MKPWLTNISYLNICLLTILTPMITNTYAYEKVEK